ncbi:MAG TPA: hypothetical protein VFZ69_12525 [Longimicrobiales bacterium]
MAKPATRPYWLHSGTETCHACTHVYVLETGVHCVGCDHGVCMHCVIVEKVTSEAWCPECHSSQEEE